MLNVLEQQLRDEDPQLRGSATGSMGELYKADVHLIVKHPSAWQAWLGRQNDKSPLVRMSLTNAIGLLLPNLRDTSTIEEVLMVLASKLRDNDKSVRLAACRSYGQLNHAALVHGHNSHLKTLAGRGLDIDTATQEAALHSLGKLYNSVYTHIWYGSDIDALRKVGWIPSELFRLMDSSPEISSIVEDVVKQYIVPLPLPSSNPNVDEITWAKRLLSVIAPLDALAMRKMLLMSALARPRPTIIDHFACALKQVNVNSEDVINPRLTKIIACISSGLRHPPDALRDLHTFANLKIPGLFELFEQCIDPRVDLRTLVNSTKQLMDTIPTSIAPTIDLLLRRASLRIINRSSIPALIRCSRGSESATAANASRILAYVGKHFPELYTLEHAEQSTPEQFMPDLSDRDVPGRSELVMRILSAIARCDSQPLNFHKSNLQKLKSLALAPETSFRGTKFTARFIIFSKDSDICKELFDETCETLKNTSLDVRVAAVLYQFACFSPTVFDSRSSEILAALNPLLVPQDNLDDDWTFTQPVSDSIRAKEFALKVYRHYGRTHASSEEIRGVVLEILTAWVAWFKKGSTEILNVQAAISLLYLSLSPQYTDDVARLIPQISLAVQAGDFVIRIAFIRKLIDLSSKPMFPCHYTAIVFLTALDSEPDMIALATECIAGVIRRLPTAQRGAMRLRMFTVLVHLLVHHPDFDILRVELLDLAKCVKFYLDQLVDRETIGDLSKVAREGKSFCYRQNPVHSRRLTIICDLAHELINIWARSYSSPDRIALVEDNTQYASPWLLIPDIEYAPNHHHVCLTEEMLEWVRSEYTSSNMLSPLHFTVPALPPRDTSKELKTAIANINSSHLVCLDAGQWLNDEIVNLCTALFYEKHKVEPDTFVFSSFVSSLLAQDFDRVVQWYKSVNLISKKFLVVPVNKSKHWYLFIICHPRRTFRPQILTLDSLNFGHTHEIALWDKYLQARSKADGYTMDFFEPAKQVPIEVPQQPNGTDCGVYMLYFLNKFLADPQACYDAMVGSAKLACDVDAIRNFRRELKAMILSRLNIYLSS
ncbi:hypothetical protein DFH06DRAFT_1234405 [Mycena polygramma]|nr:hypothetical protein DFH06DRAFT_1234405 [Mycena polygramma]